MKKIIAAILLSGFLLVPVTAFAENVDILNPVCNNPNKAPGSEEPTVCKERLSKDTDKDPVFGPDGVLSKVVNILSIIGGIMAVFTIIIAGVRNKPLVV